MSDGSILVSACLLGLRCRYDGKEEPRGRVVALAREEKVVPVCPEQFGGLPTPRPKARLLGGDGREVLRGRARVVNEEGEDVTGNFLRGAEETLKLAKIFRARRALLRSQSPSCGVNEVYIADEGRGEAVLRPGMGVTTALLLQEGIEAEEVE